MNKSAGNFNRVIDRALGLPLIMLKGLVYGYRYLISPVLPPSCRFEPSCSSYALEALRKHGALKGCGLTLARLARCQPWGSSGYDPVPDCTHDHTPRHNSALSAKH